jgi:DNA-binding response OmpR family regulator
MPHIPSGKELAPLMALRPHRILIVNDDKPNAEELAEQLRKVGHVVEIAPAEPRAVEMESTFKPDIAIIDLGLQGTAACALARSLRARANRDVILVADGGTVEDHDRASQVGCFDDHVSRIHGKPFWLRSQPAVRVRSTLPILKGGDTIGIHVWCDAD